ncbi:MULTISPECIES: spore cortex-lytic enzyme [unclassified Bacillus cereus group]|uniref:spore cortex-lytic enzyme n=1 Tax=unclassified Bacillus cereus group TaxID=2750818 RepID=UPI001F56E3C7|nr:MULTISPECIES: spore cortex-lytic enzyme [unclassified Bacillus cereus group]
MRKISILKILILLVLISISVIVSSEQTKNVQAFSNQVIQRGASGEDVIELQSRLKYNGYYTGKVDGVFGWGTYWALRNFQQKFGLPVDGLAGPKTKQMLVKATKYEKSSANKSGGGQSNKPAQNKGTNVPNGYSQNDIQLMANAVYGEARGEPYIGQVAVAAVILHRVTSPSFPNTVSGVIFEPRAFTAVADGQIYLTPNETAKKAVLDAINGWDPTGNALYYFNPDTATSKWIWSRPQIKKIGKHIFCK